MDLDAYFKDAPAELEIAGTEPDYKLLKVYAFNAYFNADITYTDEVNDGCTYRRDKYQGIDAVYINESLEENTIECLHAYHAENNIFNIGEIFEILSKITHELDDVRKGYFVNHNEEADNLLKEYLAESQSKKIIIRIITDYDCSSEEQYNLNKSIAEFDVSVKNYDVSVVMVYRNDVIDTIESNKAPFDYVEKGQLTLDLPNNILKFEDHSIVCNISAKSLKKLWEDEGSRGLLAMNLRYYIKSANIDNRIEDSILFDGGNFWYLNNGIIIVCNDYLIKDNKIELKQFSIVNGGQTSRMIGTIPFEKDFYICCKIIKNVFESPQEKNLFISKVAEASNTQKPIKAKDIIANRIEQRNLKSLLQENGIFIEIKRGEKYNHEIYKEQWQRTKNNELAQDLYSFVYMEPGPSRNSISTLLQNDDKYKTIFSKHTYSVGFLRDLLFLEKAFKEYQKIVKKEEDNNNENTIFKKGLVKNGLWYCLATIGYILKLYYNSKYCDDVVKYMNSDVMFDLYSPELAFSHSFIDQSMSFDEFKKKAFNLFDFIFAQIIVPQFSMAKTMNQSLVYSNWTKSNTGFNMIRKMINVTTFQNDSNYLIKPVCEFFTRITTDQREENGKEYADYCAKNKKIKARDSSGIELNENDEALRNELMIYRMNVSNEKHIAEKLVFTDKMIDKMIFEKPLVIDELKKIVSAKTAYYCGKEILSIIQKYL